MVKSFVKWAPGSISVTNVRFLFSRHWLSISTKLDLLRCSNYMALILTLDSLPTVGTMLHRQRLD